MRPKSRHLGKINTKSETEAHKKSKQTNRQTRDRAFCELLFPLRLSLSLLLVCFVDVEMEQLLGLELDMSTKLLSNRIE